MDGIYKRQITSSGTTAMRQVQEILRNTRQSLRDLIQQELLAGNFGEVAEIARVAEAVALLAVERGGNRGNDSPDLESEQHGQPGTQNVRQGVAAESRGFVKEAKESTHANRKYPRFERQSDRLVKIGWSKKDRRPYEHKAPKELIALVQAALLKTANLKGDFGVEEILPMTDAGGNDVPSYQVYLVLAWFRALGSVERRGKDGYRLDRSRLAEPVLSAEWESLTPKEQ